MKKLQKALEMSVAPAIGFVIVLVALSLSAGTKVQRFLTKGVS